MDYDTYRRSYHHYILSVKHTSLFLDVASHLFQDFPKNLPKDLGETLTNDVRSILTQFTSSVSDDKAPTRHLKVESKSPYAMDIFLIYITNFFADSSKPLNAIDFERLLYSQSLVMTFAHIDAFMADSLRTIYQVRPQALSSNKKVDIVDILSCGTWENLIDSLVERYVFEIGWKSVAKRVEFLRDKLGIIIDYPESALDQLGHAEEIRNIVLHNGGRVSDEYIARTQETNISVGDLVPITHEYVSEVSSEAMLLAGELFVGIAKKFFEVEGRIDNVFQRASK